VLRSAPSDGSTRHGRSARISIAPACIWHPGRSTDWEDRFGARPAANQYAQLRTWDAADISANGLYGGDLQRALRAIRARVLLMPGETDLYFRVADNAAELPFLAEAELKPIPSIWGHRAGNPAPNPEDAQFVRQAVRDWLAR
jgi:homoserine O-acetyltransferase